MVADALPPRDISPFIIWTQRRTGGTSLSQLLSRCSGLPGWQDEAFNADREHGAVTRAYQADRNEATLEASVAAVLAQRRIVKYCIETVPWPVTRAVLQRSHAMGYRHVLLLRRNEAERQLSLVLADLTGAWGPKDAPERYRDLARGRTVLPPADLRALRAQVHADAAYLGRLLRQFLLLQAEYHLVFYEDLFSGPEAARRARLATLTGSLGLPPLPADDPLLHEALMERWQKTRTIHAFLPNLSEATAAIEAEA